MTAVERRAHANLDRRLRVSHLVMNLDRRKIAAMRRNIEVICAIPG
jgi:hypothetical protein